MQDDENRYKSLACFHKTEVSVEVCQGPDCAGLGGGAAILEIEELVQEHNEGEAEIKSVIKGGCREFCTVGPNIHARIGKQIIESFHHVNDASKCKSVVERSASFSGNSTRSTVQHSETSRFENLSLNLHQSMMSRRAERMRWEALKKVSRTIAKCNTLANKTCRPSEGGKSKQRKLQSYKTTIMEYLSSASRAEIAAVKPGMDRERATRRADRLLRNTICKLESCYGEGSSDEDTEISSDVENGGCTSK